MTPSRPISLDHIRAWSTRTKLVDADLKEAAPQTKIFWTNLMRLLVTKRVESASVTQGHGK